MRPLLVVLVAVMVSLAVQHGSSRVALPSIYPSPPGATSAPTPLVPGPAGVAPFVTASGVTLGLQAVASALTALAALRWGLGPALLAGVAAAVHPAGAAALGAREGVALAAL
ncbi:MAG: hypothetical protein AB1486_00005, partial [Planctomycetota bacterium]